MRLAKLTNGNTVEQVIICRSVAWAETYLGGVWINAEGAGVGYTWDVDRNVFIPPQPVYNWDLDPETNDWFFPEGSHVYIPCDPQLIVGLSSGLYALIDPDKQGMYAGLLWHPSGADWPHWPLLQLRTTDVVPIALQADASKLNAVLDAFVYGGGITEQERDGIVNAVRIHAGSIVQIADLIPASWQPYIMTREQVEAAGYFQS